MDLLVFIVNPDKGERVIEHAYKNGILGGTIILGEGTVRNTLLRKLGLDNAHKEVVLLIAPSDIAKMTFDYVSHKKELNKKNQGIALRTSINHIRGITDRIIGYSKQIKPDVIHEREEDKGDNETMYQALIALVNQGEGQDVMRVAEKHGAGGGTIIKARGAGAAEAQEVFGMQIEPEKEILLIITPTDTVSEIARGIGDYLNIDEENTGIMFTVGLDETRGLYSPE